MKKILPLLGLCTLPIWAQSPLEVKIAARELALVGTGAADQFQDLQTFLQSGGTWNQLKFTDQASAQKGSKYLLAQADYASAEAFLDLRNEPVVLSIGKWNANYPVSVQIYDWQGNQVANLGNLSPKSSGSYVLAGPNFNEKSNADEIIHLSALGRLQIRFYNPKIADKNSALQILNAFKLQKFSVFAARKTVKTYGPLLASFDPKQSQASIALLGQNLAWWTQSEDQASLDKMARGGILPNKILDFKSLSPELSNALSQGFEEGIKTIASAPKATEIGFPLFGSSADFHKSPLKFAQAHYWAGSNPESQYSIAIPIHTDGDSRPLNASIKRYTLKIKSEQFDSLKTSWSLSFYDQERHLLQGPKGAWILRSSNLREYDRDSRGDITLYLQSEKPVQDLVRNWIPLPESNWSAILRLDQPSADMKQGNWSFPSPRSFPKD